MNEDSRADVRPVETDRGLEVEALRAAVVGGQVDEVRQRGQVSFHQVNLGRAVGQGC
jgi:hypothetical protein